MTAMKFRIVKVRIETTKKGKWIGSKTAPIKYVIQYKERPFLFNKWKLYDHTAYASAELAVKHIPFRYNKKVKIVSVVDYQ